MFPLLLANNERNKIEIPLAFAMCIAINIIGNAIFTQQALNILLAVLNLFGAQFGERAKEGLPFRLQIRLWHPERIEGKLVAVNFRIGLRCSLVKKLMIHPSSCSPFCKIGKLGIVNGNSGREFEIRKSWYDFFDTCSTHL
jgi:hypothetical protein